MKHQDFIDQFLKVKDESDEFGHILWLPGSKFNNVLQGECTDILNAYMDVGRDHALTFFISSPDDRHQEFATLKEFPMWLRRKVITYIKSLKPHD